jgi:predicted nuclease of restriction endonuclease-like (RecB) superfamily
MNAPTPSVEDHLYKRITTILDDARSKVARTVNTAMVHAYWLIGRELVEVDQRGERRAEYGVEVVNRVAARLSQQFGKGFSPASLRRMRQFYLGFPSGSAILGADREKCSTPLSISASSAPFPPILGWSHYLVLLRVHNLQARSFYEIEAAREGWSVRELERQVAALLFERLARSRAPDEVLSLAREGQRIASAGDVIKDPFVLEFLDLRHTHSAHERDLEQAIIDRLEGFLLELGKGFCFVARQKRITLEGDHFYVDLVLYNRLLRCFVLVDLKLGKLTHQDLGQMQMYVHYFDRFQRVEHEAKTIGIVLCSAKNDAMVRITLPEDEEQIMAARYQMALPSEEELRTALTHEREAAERLLRLSSPSVGGADGQATARAVSLAASDGAPTT